MNEQQILSIRGALKELLAIITQQGASLSDDTKVKLAQLLEKAASRISQLQMEQQTLQVSTPGADLLWILSGSKPEVFVNYLNTFPDPALNALAKNPTQLQQVIERLSQEMPAGAPQQTDGVPKADINSSNIYGFQYSPKSGKLLVRFQGGSVYGYDGIPPAIFQIFQAGAIPAKTNGKNQYGRWWRGKNPSLGAAFHQLIKLGNFPYQKIK